MSTYVSAGLDPFNPPGAVAERLGHSESDPGQPAESDDPDAHRPGDFDRDNLLVGVAPRATVDRRSREAFDVSAHRRVAR